MDARLSTKLRALTTLAVVAVVGVHAYNVAGAESGTDGVGGFIQYFISQGLCRWPAGLLLVMSGFLFFRTFKPTLAGYTGKLSRRLRTIALPFLIWSALSLLAYWTLPRVLPALGFYQTGTAPQIDGVEAVRLWLLDPVNFPLWFLQALMFCVVISPLIYLLASRLGLIAPLLLSPLWLLHVRPDNYFVGGAVMFFTLGAALALRPDKVPSVSPWVARVIPVVWLVACVLSTVFLRGHAASWDRYIDLTIYALGMASIWSTYDLIVRRGGLERWVLMLAPFTFFLYVAHQPILKLTKRMLNAELGSGDGAALLVFFVAPALTIALCVGVAALLRRVVPDVYAVLTGGRTGRRAPALPPAAPVVQPEQTAEPRSRSEPSTAPGAAPVTSGLGKRLEGA